MTQFNWLRAVEGALVTAVITGASAYQIASQAPSATTEAIASTVVVTFIVAFVKGVGQSFQPAALVQTTITQPAGTSALTETIASPPPVASSPLAPFPESPKVP